MVVGRRHVVRVVWVVARGAVVLVMVIEEGTVVAVVTREIATTSIRKALNTFISSKIPSALSRTMNNTPRKVWDIISVL